MNRKHDTVFKEGMAENPSNQIQLYGLRRDSWKKSQKEQWPYSEFGQTQNEQLRWNKK
jgi:hypothetical protein